ncbi:MAG TPA: peroxidase-related enzyme [Terriglobales bacterium]|nr:peroxidase-related enzyme [Terriglobales bacterium]
MAHIQVPEGAPGILGPMAISPESTKALRELADVLLRSPNTLTPAEREMIATYVSSQNDCCFCQLSHGAAAAEHLGGNYDLIDRVKRDYAATEISDKLKALLAIAGKVQKGGKHVTAEDVARARQHGATDKEIHDTVLVAAAFCMFNRYVDGLDTWQPTDPNDYREMGKIMAHDGYTRPDWEKKGEAA